MSMVSYAQNHEDVLLARLFRPGLPGFYIDVGANDPVSCSVTKHFYDSGWRGVNLEPSTHVFRRLAAERRRDVNLNAGLSDAPATLAFFEFDPPWTGASTFSREQAELHREAGLTFVERDVEVTTLARICEEHADGEIDFLSIDVEGHEARVIGGGDWSRWRPRVVVVEATEPTTAIPAHDRWEPALLGSGYLFAFFDGLNRYYVREEDAALLPALTTPVNVLDDYVSHDLNSSRSELAAARALLQSVRAQYGTFPEALRSLQAHYEHLEREAAGIRAEVGAMQVSVHQAEAVCSEVRARCDVLQLESERLLTRLGELESLGPRTLGMARALRHTADRFPTAAAAARTALHSARRLQGRRRAG